MERENVLRNLFNSLDYDNSGYIEFAELTTLNSRLTPHRNQEDTKRLLETFDENLDGKVSQDEFVSKTLELGRDLSDDDFVNVIATTLTSSDDEIRQELKSMLKNKNSNSKFKSFISSTAFDNRTYLEMNVLPTLRPVLRKLLVRLQEEHIQLAKGVYWDDQGYRPPGWKPFNPFLWLADELRKQFHADANAETRKHTDDDSHESAKAKQFMSLEKNEKIKELFQMLAEVDSARVEILSVIDALADDSNEDSKSKVFQIIDSVSPKEPGHLTQTEFSIVTERLFASSASSTSTSSTNSENIDISQSAGDNTFNHYALEAWEKIRFSKMSRKEKISLVFNLVDKDESNSLELDEIFALGQMLKPGTSIKQAKLTMRWLDNSDGEKEDEDTKKKSILLSINQEDFVKAMCTMTAEMTDEQFNNGMRNLVTAFKTDSPIDGTSSMAEPLQQYVRCLPTYETAQQSSVMFVRSIMEDKDHDYNIIFIDVRSEPEYNVSSLPEAIHMDVDEHGNLEENVREAVGKLDLPSLSELSSSFIVVFDTAGERGGLAAISLSQRLSLPVRNLCGGLIAWVNSGGKVVDLQGNVVKKLHTFRPEMLKLIASEDKFQFEC